MVTRCAKCGRILTDAKGRRKRDGYFDSSLVDRKKEYEQRQTKKADVWAWCKECCESETRKQANNNQKKVRRERDGN
jgi:hypothetical protein